jgi:hypothetical protein
MVDKQKSIALSVKRLITLAENDTNYYIRNNSSVYRSIVKYKDDKSRTK